MAQGASGELQSGLRIRPNPVERTARAAILAPTGEPGETDPMEDWMVRYFSLSIIPALALLAAPDPARAQSSAALTGTVSSQEEGAMEGVLVSAKKEGSTITVTVVSDDKGHFSFPAGRLDPGKYAL